MDSSLDFLKRWQVMAEEIINFSRQNSRCEVVHVTSGSRIQQLYATVGILRNPLTATTVESYLLRCAIARRYPSHPVHTDS